MRIEDDKIVIETIEQAEFISKLMDEPSKLNDKMKEALDRYAEVCHGKDFENFKLEV